MKTTTITILFIFLIGLSLYAALGNAQMGSGYGMGSGMMGSGYGMGSGMMGSGYGNGSGYGYDPQYRQSRKPVDEQDAHRISENYLQSVQNPNLQLGKIKDLGSVFEVEIVTKKSGDLVSKIAINKNTGAMNFVY